MTLFDPLQIRGIKFRNRILVSPMCQYSSIDGFANDWHLVHLGSRAVGGAAAVFVEATAVEAIGRISPGDMGLWKDQHIEPFTRITRFIKQQGAVPGIQIAHAGRKGSTEVPWRGGKALASSDPDAWEPVAPSAIAAAKAVVRDVVAATPGEATALTARAIAKQRTSPEGQEGLRAFLERRPAAWHDR